MLYKNNYKKVNYYIQSLCRNEKLSEDLTQETFYKVLVYVVGKRDFIVNTKWLMKIAHNVFIDYIRKNHMALESLENCSTIPTIQLKEEKDVIVSVLNQLPVRYKSIILLCDHYGFSYSEIADIMSSTEAAVKVTLFRARKRFKEVYNEYERA